MKADLVERLGNAPRDGSPILLLLGETIPDVPDWRVGSHMGPDECLQLGYREYARFGGWIIWNTDNDWFVVDDSEPLAWAPLPARAVLQSIQTRRNEDGE